MRKPSPLATVSAALALLWIGSASFAGTSGQGEWTEYGDTIQARLSELHFTKVPGRPSPKEYHFSRFCYIADEVRVAEGCIGGEIPPPPQGCERGEWVEPRWARLRDTGDGPGPWILETGYTCPGDPDFPVRITDFAELPLAPSPLSTQPSAGWVYAGLETVAFSEDFPQGFEVTLLGTPFQVAALPTTYTWDFGDGSPTVTTTDPGRPWPDHSVAHTYATKGSAVISVLTTWEGYFRESEFDDWTEIGGTAETLTTGTPITIHTARTRLVEDDLS